MQLSDFLTVTQPLGPFRHERILRRTNNAAASTLVYWVKTFDHITSRDSTFIMGRRGSGKTAIVSAYLALSENDEEEFHQVSANAKFEICVFVNSWQQLASLVDKVAADAQHSLGGSNDWSSLLPETAAQLWDRRLWIVIVHHMYNLSLDDSDIRRALPLVRAFVQGDDVLPHGALTDDRLDDAFRAVRKEITDYLKDSGRKCLLIIDSLEQYPVVSPKFQKLTAGFLKCVNEFNDDGGPVRVICCIPEEIEHIFAGRAANRLKDLSDAGGAARLRWRPFDLLKIVAERYREFLKIHLTDDKGFLESIQNLNFSLRNDLKFFFDHIMPNTITNRLGKEESALAYIVRHTQLLPREFILIFNRAIIKSHELKGSWRYIEERAIVDAVEDQEPELADQILKPYEPIYPNLIDACRNVIPELKPIFSNADADKWKSKLRKLAGHECDDPLSVAYQMGVIGYLDPNTPSNNTLYEYGHFHYNAKTPIVFGSGRQYCVHPIFSGTWKLKRTAADDKFVYPARIAEILWEE